MAFEALFIMNMLAQLSKRTTTHVNHHTLPLPPPSSQPTECVQEHVEHVAHDGSAVEFLGARPGGLHALEDGTSQAEVLAGPLVVEGGEVLQLPILLHLRAGWSGGTVRLSWTGGR